MKQLNKNLLLWLVSSFLLSACFNGSDSDKDSNNSSNQLKELSRQMADSDPSMIIDPGALSTDIATLFGDADSAPVDVKDGDTVQSVINRID